MTILLTLACRAGNETGSERKALTFISSVGVCGPLGLSETVKEDTLGTNLATEFPGSGGYAYG